MNDSNLLICPDPTCHQPTLSTQNAIVGDILECSNCGAGSELISLDPPSVRLIEEDK